MANKISKELGKRLTETQGAMSTLYHILGQFGIRLQQLNKMFYFRLPNYSPNPISLFKFVYKQLVKTWDWKKGVNEKTFLAKSPYNSIVGWEHNGHEQTGDGWMFNMILQDGTRSDNAFTYYGKVN